MTALIPSTTRRLLAVFEMLVRWYPAGFRMRFEQEMRLTYQDWLYSDHSAATVYSESYMILQLAGDMLPAIVRERFVEGRSNMIGIKILQGFGVALLAAWAIVWAWFITKWTGLLDIVDPQRWLLGKDYSIVNDIFGAALYLIPFLVLLAFVIPVLKIQMRIENGDGVLMFRLGRMGKLQAWVSWVCLAGTVVLWGLVFFGARMGWW